MGICVGLKGSRRSEPTNVPCAGKERFSQKVGVQHTVLLTSRELTAAEVDKEWPPEVLMVDKSCVLPGATLVLQRKFTGVLVPTKEVARLVIDQ